MKKMEFGFIFDKTKDNLHKLKKMNLATCNVVGDWLITQGIDENKRMETAVACLNVLDGIINKMKIKDKCMFRILIGEKKIEVMATKGDKEHKKQQPEDKSRKLVEHFKQISKEIWIIAENKEEGKTNEEEDESIRILINI